MVPTGMRIPTAKYLAHISNSSTELLRLSDGATWCSVPSCPGWTLAELLHHVGAVYTDVAALIRERPVAGQVVWKRLGPVAPPGDRLVEWFHLATDDMLSAFSAAVPDESAWSWSMNQTVGFWIRRMCHETVVHHWDAAAGRGEEMVIDPVLACDGLDEFLTEFVPLMRRRRGARAASGEHFMFECVDADAAWGVALDASSATVTYRNPPSENHSITVRAQAAQLLLILWQRLPPSAATVSAPTGLDRWFELVGCP
jgi:uncharacterized protein (TIGR03083 family)